ncbi:MAG: hypothetical protein Kow00108_18550 [Calditrichia bacterium]
MKLKNRITFIILMVVMALGLNQCTLKEPQMPTWVVPFIIPLENYTFTMEDLVEDSTLFVINPEDSSVSIEISDSIEKQTIDQSDLTLAAFDSSTVFSLDTVVIDSFDIIKLEPGALSLRNLAPGLTNFVDSTIMIPETDVTGMKVEVPTVEFNSIHVYSAKLELFITNNLPVPILAGTELYMYGSSSPEIQDTLLAQFILMQDLQPGERYQFPDKMVNDKWLVSPLYYFFQNARLGASSQLVLITDSLLTNSEVVIDLKLCEVKADRAIAKLKEHTYSWKEKVAIDDENLLYYGEVASGLIRIDVTNSLPVGGNIVIKFENIRRADNSPYSETIYLHPMQQNPINIDLAGLSVVGLNELGNPDFTHSTPVDSILYEIDVTNDATEGAVVIDATDSIFVELRTTDIIFNAFKGVLATQTIEFDPIEQTDISDYQAYEGEIKFNNLKLVINLYNELNIENINFELHLEGYHKENGIITETVAISPLLQSTLQPGTSGSPALNTFEISGPEIEQLVNILPTDIRVWGSATVDGMVDVEAGQGIYGDYQFISPMEIKLENPIAMTSEEDTLTEDDIDEDMQDNIEDSKVEMVTITANIVNTMPIGGELYLVFDSTDTNPDIFDTSRVQLVIKVDQFRPAEVGDDGTVIAPTLIEQTIQLTNNDIQVFAHPPVRWGYLLKLNPTDSTVNNGFVKFLSTNGIDVKGQIELNYKMGDDNE